MDTASYKTGQFPGAALEALCARVYGDNPAYAAALSAELVSQLGPANPFLKLGSRENFIVSSRGEARAHACAVTDPRLPAGTGLIGYFEADCREAAALALEAACSSLARRGARAVFGPVNDTVWQRYGVSAAGGLPPYLGEPFAPVAYASYFTEAGFVPADRRVTAAVSAEESPFASYGADRARLEAEGFSFRVLDAAGLAARAADLHAMASAVFKDSPLFVPAGLDEFLYSAGPRAAGSTAALAEDREGRAAAFLWGMPDGLSGGGSFIFKTVAVMPPHRERGLGRALFWSLASAVKADRYILSTMREGNAAIARLAARGAAARREYLTFRKALC